MQGIADLTSDNTFVGIGKCRKRNNVTRHRFGALFEEAPFILNLKQRNSSGVTRE